MRRLMLHTAMCLAVALSGPTTRTFHNEGQETLGPDISPYAKRPKKGKGERKANRANRWG